MTRSSRTLVRARDHLALAAAVALAACGKHGAPAPAIDAAPAPFCTPTHGQKLHLVQVATNLHAPIFATAPAGDPRLWVVERAGRIRLIGADGVLRDTPYLDISSMVSLAGEQGLLGLAFHPDFAHNGKFYVDYTQRDGAEVLAEYTADPKAETAPTTARVLITQMDPANNHNGGMIQFGTDGFLYMSIGDGGGGGDTYHNGQNQQTFMAKILRIDPDHPAGGKPYGIPADNPWASGPGVPEMFVWGLRNPWRFSIDPATGDLYIGDVGQGKMEEIDVVPHGTRGQDFGWSVWEGTSCFAADQTMCADPSKYTAPVLAYDRTSSGQCAVMGGFVYRGACMPDLVGAYFWGDWCSGEIDTFVYSGGQATQQVNHTAELGQNVLHSNLASFGVDGYGELYVLAITSGQLFRVEAGS